MILDCTAVILAGGNSSRMGRDKASLLLNGETLLQNVIGRVEPLFTQTLLSVRQPRSDVALPQVCDTQADGGPMVGLISVLETITAPWVFIVACDMPFVVPALIERLANYRACHQVVIPVVNEQAQPLAAFYARNCLPVLQKGLKAGNKSLLGALKHLDVHYVEANEMEQFDPQLRSFFDLDTPQDVALAEGMK